MFNAASILFCVGMDQCSYVDGKDVLLWGID